MTKLDEEEAKEVIIRLNAILWRLDQINFQIEDLKKEINKETL